MTKELVYNLIRKSPSNLVRIGKAIGLNFEGFLGHYVIFDHMSTEEAFLKVSEDIVSVYEDKMDIWNSIQKNLEL